MMHLAEIDISETKDRCDPNYFVFHKELLNFRQPGVKIFELGELVKNIFRGKSPGREGYVDEGVLVLKSVNIGNYFLEKARFSYAKEGFYQKNKKFNPKDEEIILTSTGEGTIGRAIIFLPQIYGIDKCLITEKVTILRNIDRQKISPYYLLAFLWSKYGKLQLEMYSRGSTGRTELYPKDIAKVVILVPEWNIQKEIEELVKKAHQKKKLADEKYEEANRLLLKEIGLDSLVITKQKTFEIESEETKERLDVDYFKSKYKSIIDLLQQNEKRGLFKLQKLSNVCKFKKGIEVGSYTYTKEGVLFLRVSNISETGLIERESSEYIPTYLFEQIKEEYAVKENDILYTKDGTIGIALVVDKDFPVSINSMGVVRLQSKGIDPYYIALVLNSIACRSQSDREAIGAVIKHYNFTKLKNLLVPIASRQKQENIAELVKQSFSLRKEAKQLLDEATKRVENFCK